MDPLQRFVATLEKTAGPAVAAAVGRLLEAAESAACRAPVTISYSADEDGETITIELPGPRQRIRLLTMWCETGRVRVWHAVPGLAAGLSADLAATALAAADWMDGARW